MKRISLVFILVILTLCGCQKPAISVEDGTTTTETGDPESGDIDESDPSGTGNDDIVDVDGSVEAELDEAEFTTVIDIVWSGATATVTNGSSLKISQEGAHIVIGEPTAAGKKVRINLSGTSDDGSLKIYNGVKADYSNKKMLLNFNEVSLTSSTGPAINIQSGKTVYVLLDGSNSLCDAATYSGIPEGEDAKGCFFSEKQLVFSGTGSLTVKGQNKHAVCVDDYVTFQGGKLIVSGAASDGIHANNYVRVEAGTLDITSDGEGIQCEEAEDGYYYQMGGSVTITGKGEKSGGIETASDIVIDGGTLKITSSGNAAKCLKSDNNISISGGKLELMATGGGMYDTEDKEAKAAACIKAENIVTLAGGEVICKSTGSGGKGINSYQFVCNSPTILDVSTSGSTYKYSSQTCRPKAIKATNGLTVNGGSINILTTGTEGEGLESKSWVEINGGSTIIQTKDDGINAATTITFNGGYTYVYSTGNDGIDSNYNKAGSIVVNDGVVITHAASSPEGGFDADSEANLSFNGGFAFSSGGQQGGGGGRGGFGPGAGSPSGSSPSCTQPTFTWTGSISTGWFTVTDASGNVVMSCYVPRSISSNYSVVSAPLNSGSTYKYGVLSSAPSGATEVFGKYFYGDGTATGLSGSFTASSGFFSL